MLRSDYLCDDEDDGTVGKGCGEEKAKVCFEMNPPKAVRHCGSHHGVDPGEGAVEADHDQAVARLGARGLLAEVGEEGEAGQRDIR